GRGGAREGGGAGLEPLREAEPERELLVVPGRPHRDGHRATAAPDLQRLPARDLVGLARALRQSQHLDSRRRVRRRLERVVLGAHARERTPQPSHIRATLATDTRAGPDYDRLGEEAGRTFYQEPRRSGVKTPTAAVHSPP